MKNLHCLEAQKQTTEEKAWRVENWFLGDSTELERKEENCFPWKLFHMNF